MYEAKHSAEQLRYLQSLPLERKIMITQTRIIDWYEHWKGQVYVSYSGGKDSTVLLELARMAYPQIPAVFVNTGLEYPEIRKFALSHGDVEDLRPRWGKAGKEHGKKPEDIITFLDTVTTYGYPLISKAVSNAIVESRRTDLRSRHSAETKEGKENGEEKKVQNDPGGDFDS
ncbi:phosphoadenosine phosphosulfate reductase family protein [Fusobacterium naviforme]|nr:phosphoadenosine phosphosulfate reductase family protein [Fusobacterium naviforme]PSL10214.1 phosphoadenosine phosphosulfate reductase family protein [Fusobacterium naviforme]STO27624.1 PUA domain (predicted RNA-binding domain) [Fusobacterium naviforme]